PRRPDRGPHPALAPTATGLSASYVQPEHSVTDEVLAHDAGPKAGPLVGDCWPGLQAGVWEGSFPVWQASSHRRKPTARPIRSPTERRYAPSASWRTSANTRRAVSSASRTSGAPT